VNEPLSNIERLVYNMNVDANLANHTGHTKFRIQATVRTYRIGMKIMHSIGLMETRDKSYIDFEVIGVVTSQDFLAVVDSQLRARASLSNAVH
jgi:hypothetical protein